MLPRVIKIIIATLGCIMATALYANSAGFNDDFFQGIDNTRWFMPTKTWGGQNGGVNSQNVHWQSVPSPVVLLWSQGDNYTGPTLPDASRSTRVGAAIVTRQSLGPGTVTVCAKLPKVLGVVSAFWLYDYHETKTPSTLEWVNEIDWEMPTDNKPDGNISYDFARANSWGGQLPGDEQNYSTRINMKLANGGMNPAEDGQFHLYSITWRERSVKAGKVVPGYISWGYAKNCDETPRELNRYIGKMAGPDYVPVRPMALWLGLWFPASGYRQYVGWAGNPNFNKAVLTISRVSYQPQGNNAAD